MFLFFIYTHHEWLIRINKFLFSYWTARTNTHQELHKLIIQNKKKENDNNKP